MQSSFDQLGDQNMNQTSANRFYFHAYMRVLAYTRGFNDSKFATADELQWPGYDRAYRAGQRKAKRSSADQGARE